LSAADRHTGRQWLPKGIELDLPIHSQKGLDRIANSLNAEWPYAALSKRGGALPSWAAPDFHAVCQCSAGNDVLFFVIHTW
jgi:hypothetical protein